jgi:hypothetical protein
MPCLAEGTAFAMSKTFSKKVGSGVASTQTRGLELSQQQEKPSREKVNLMSYDDDSNFIITDEFDNETLRLMDELGI